MAMSHLWAGRVLLRYQTLAVQRYLMHRTKKPALWIKVLASFFMTDIHLPNRRTAEPPNRRTAEPPNRRTAEPPNRRTAEPPNRRTGRRYDHGIQSGGGGA
ncbi:hypothetical protein [Carnimonas bestiolae]|uniref:hypothetical protein n=1 Tax=Carnimonas bestiolae TaxID=3402172 RepID=UPI003F4AD880